MTKFSLGLAALAFVLITPIAAQANGLGNCTLDVNSCVDGTNILGKKIVTYGVNAGGSSISDTNDSASAGNKQVETFHAARVPAGEGSNGSMVPF